MNDLLCIKVLDHDFVTGQGAGLAHGPRSAKGTRLLTSDLTGETNGGAIFRIKKWNEDRFNLCLIPREGQ